MVHRLSLLKHVSETSPARLLSMQGRSCARLVRGPLESLSIDNCDCSQRKTSTQEQDLIQAGPDTWQSLSGSLVPGNPVGSSVGQRHPPQAGVLRQLPASSI